MSLLRTVFGLLLLSLLLAFTWPASAALAAESQCVVCHTSGAKLINLTRELAAGKPAASSPLSEGEG